MKETGRKTVVMRGFGFWYGIAMELKKRKVPSSEHSKQTMGLLGGIQILGKGGERKTKVEESSRMVEGLSRRGVGGVVGGWRAKTDGSLRLRFGDY